MPCPYDQILEQETHMKAIGLLMAVFGWLIPVAGLIWTASPSIRLALSFVGIGMCLVGILSFLNGAYLKQAIWKQ